MPWFFRKARVALVRDFDHINRVLKSTGIATAS